jgi:hypothetical protein
MKIQKSKITYVCEHCDTSYTVQKKAEACEAACKEKLEADRKAEEQLDSFFLSESVTEIAETLSKYLTSKSGIECEAVFRVAPSERCSNSHSAPKGLPTNWGREPNTPTGYMGLYGSLDIDIDGGYNIKVSRVCDYLGNKFRIHTGSGGSRDHGLGWSVTIWADDFPKIKSKLEKYFQSLVEKEQYESEREQIDYDYLNTRLTYISENPSYIAANDVVREAHEKLSTIRENISEEFLTTFPKPETKSRVVLENEIDENLNSFL